MEAPYRIPELNRSVRTLAWCLSSPSLATVPETTDNAVPHLASPITITGEENGAELQTWINALNVDPAPLVKWMEQCKSARLGHQFERFWHYYWISRHGSQASLFNRQINAAGRTLGELDAVFYQGTGKPVIHKELAIKFYLGYPGTGSNDAWIGPNGKDRFDLKLKQMTERQLTLLDCTENPLPDNWDYNGFTPQLLMKGWLFYPFAHPDSPALAKPLSASVNHNRGFWLQRNGLAHLDANAKWHVLPRSEWLGWTLFNKSEDKTILNTRELVSALENLLAGDDSSVMFVQLEDSPLNTNFVEESQRWVLVDDHWPSTTC